MDLTQLLSAVGLVDTKLGAGVLGMVLGWALKFAYDVATDRRELSKKKAEERMKRAKSCAGTVSDFIRDYNNVEDRDFKQLLGYNSYRGIVWLESQGYLKHVKVKEIEKVLDRLHGPAEKPTRFTFPQPMVPLNEEQLWLRSNLLAKLENERNRWKKVYE